MRKRASAFLAVLSYPLRYSPVRRPDSRIRRPLPVNLAIPDDLASGKVPFSSMVNGVLSDVVQLAIQ
jgi:hypothetical protein